MKNILLRGVGLLLLIGFLALSHATISTYAAEPAQDKTAIQAETLKKSSPYTLDKAKVPNSDAEAFSIGSAMIRAIIFSIAAHDDKQFVSEASLELANLIDLLGGHPEEKLLREALRMVVRGTGTIEQRFDLIDQARELHRRELAGTALWYFDAGVIVPYITVSVYAKDAKLLQSDLKFLENLVATAPQGVPGGLLNPMRELARLAKQSAFSEKDFLAIDKGVDSMVDAVYS